MADNKKTSFIDYANQLVKHLDENKEVTLKKSLNKNVAIEVLDNNMGFEPSPLVKSILGYLDKQGEVEKLAFSVDPTQATNYKGIWEAKINLTPDVLLKRISAVDSLIGTIVLTRENQISRFARPRPDRSSMGYVIQPRPETLETIKKEKDSKIKKKKKQQLLKRMAEAIKSLYTCGPTDGWDKNELITFPQFVRETVRSVLTVGRLATEICHKPDINGNAKFAGFRPIDAGTIYRAVPGNRSAASLRKNAIEQLRRLNNKKINPKLFADDKYKWIQVIKDKPVQAFTDEECVVYNFYPVPDIEANGYPLTPIDIMMDAVTTHINISTTNKLYFQNGRSAKGMVVVRSDNVSDSIIGRIKQQFNSSINNVNNSARTPIFGIGADDEISWVSLDASTRDMEFQYLSDMNARVIFSSFQMSPDEVPGYTYLSRATGQQSISESNNEFKLEAARDAGLVPLMSQYEDFINHHILPLIDPVIAKLCVFKMVGLNANTPEKEAIRLQEDMALHLTFDEILSAVEKDPIGKKYGGEFPLNPNYQQILDKYLTVGEIKEFFFGVKHASKDPSLSYMRDQYWFQWQQLVMQKDQLDKNNEIQDIQMKQQLQVQEQQQGQQEAQQNEEQNQKEDNDGELDQVIEQGLNSLKEDK